MAEAKSTVHAPSELILARCRAFSAGDFGFIYDSYHAESNFRRQFSDRDGYCQYAEETLGPGYEIIDCKILDQDSDDSEARVVFLMQMVVHGEIQIYAELAWLKREGQGWLYHRGQKMTADELPDAPESLTIDDFSRLDPRTVF